MQGFYPKMSLPMEFWKIDDDEIFFEALGYLHLHIAGALEKGVEELPEGYRLAYPIFWLEDDYCINGWTALTNAGEWLLPSAIDAYRRIGMESEAKALEAALESCRKDPHDEYLAEAAYKSVPNAYADDEVKNEALLSFFRKNAHLFEVRDA
jgi:hypothetical protein